MGFRAGRIGGGPKECKVQSVEGQQSPQQQINKAPPAPLRVGMRSLMASMAGGGSSSASFS